MPLPLWSLYQTYKPRVEVPHGYFFSAASAGTAVDTLSVAAAKGLSPKGPLVAAIPGAAAVVGSAGAASVAGGAAGAGVVSVLTSASVGLAGLSAAGAGTEVGAGVLSATWVGAGAGGAFEVLASVQMKPREE